MKKINIDMAKVGNAVKGFGNFVLSAAMVAAPYMYLKSDSVKVRYISNASYSDAISAVLNSNMLSLYKTEIVNILPKDGDAELYKSIIAVINSDMMSRYKVEIIKDICDGFIHDEES